MALVIVTVGAVAVITSFQFFGFILFRTLGDIWIFWMILLGLTTLCSMVFSISEVTNNADAERKMRWIFLYLLLWLGMFFLFGEDFGDGYQKIAYGIAETQGKILFMLYIFLLVLFAAVITGYLGKLYKKKNQCICFIRRLM